ncbi:MAG: NADH-dependent flavin oxidoreductase [candidate division Zixibacteria bacterium]|nr:NADH-dependent flavin oxidoreductase [candidate division Zixibacteria bacterium]
MDRTDNRPNGSSRLFEPVSVAKTFRLPNRLIMAPMTTTAGHDNGEISDEEIAYLSQRAAGGIGTIMSPACYVHKSGHAFPGQIGVHSDDMIPGLTRCTEAIRKNGGVSILQIHHGGNAAKSEFTGHAPWAPSAVQNRTGTSEMPTAMTVNQIQDVISAFATAARRAQRSGFDGIELHGANTYLFQQFFSSFTNKRDDEYGTQTWENRCRFAADVVIAVRAEVGPDYPILYRVSPEEPEPDGYTTEDVVELLRRIVPLGIDVVHVSTWEYGTGLYPEPSPGQHTTLRIKRAVDVPVVGVGQIRTPEQALRVLDDGVNLVALGRVLLFEKDWGVKAQSDRASEIRTQITTVEEVDQLDVPPKMKPYIRRFFPDRI